MDSGWKDEVLDAIEAVQAERKKTRHFKPSLWDLFDLDTQNVGRDTPSDRGECLVRVTPKTLSKLRGWLEANEEEVEKRFGHNAFLGLRADVSIIAWMSYLPPDRPFGNVVGYKRSGRTLDSALPIKLELLRRERGYKSERDLAKELRVPRSTLKHIILRMEEIGFSLESFTTEDLNYVIRGPEHKG
ncbi:MAG: hypothetical protein H0X71_06490 [Rubrobacter sp.]|nr:hypothetical protein [Rubrobacter sp.]